MSYVQSLLMYVCATWAITRGDEESLRIFERKVLRKIYEPMFNNAKLKSEIRTIIITDERK